MQQSTAILFDFTPTSFSELCRDPHGVRVELVEVTGMRLRDIDELLDSLAVELAACFDARPGYLRIVVWSGAAWLVDHDLEEATEVRVQLDAGLRALQNPWRVPMVGQVGCAVLDGPLPDGLASLRVRDVQDLDYMRERAPERRSERRR